MKNMKKILVLAAMLSVLCALMCVNAFAARGTIESITPAENSGATFTVAQDPVKFGMEYTTNEAGKDGMFLVLVVRGDLDKSNGTIAPRAGDILYVNQTTADGNKVSFADGVIYPSDIENGSEIYLAGAGLDQLTLMGTIATSGYTVSGTVTSYLVADGQVTVELWESDAATAAYTTTTTNGAYSIAEVEAGTYTMKVSKANHVTREYTITVSGAAVAQNAKIHPIGDVNGNGDIDMFDYIQIKQHAQTVKSLADYALECADISGEGDVNMLDYIKAKQHAQNVVKQW